MKILVMPGEKLLVLFFPLQGEEQAWKLDVCGMVTGVGVAMSTITGGVTLAVMVGGTVVVVAAYVIVGI